MRPQENIVRLIVAKHIDILEMARLASGIGVQIDILNQLDLLDLALDIIGFPPDNTREFDIDIVLNEVSTAPYKQSGNQIYLDGQ